MLRKTQAKINRVIVLEEMDFIWDSKDLFELRKMWNKDYGIKYMAEYFDRDPDEIMIAIIHLAKEKRIEVRRNGLIGLK